MIQFYKPNAKNTGAATSFWYNPQQKAFWASIIRQASWDAKSRTGSFQKNKNIQEKNVKIKLNLNEIGGILDCLENNREFSAFHNSPQAEHITKMKFAPYVKEEETLNLGDIVVANEKATLTGELTKTEKKQLGFIFFASKEPKDDPSQKSNFSIALNFGEAIALRECLLFMMGSLFSDQVQAIKDKPREQQSSKPVPKKREVVAASPVDLDDIVF